MDQVTVKVELKAEHANASASERQESVKELQHHIKSFIGISTRIDIVETGGIERSVGKAKRVIDKRPKA
jgi:phenylacetate-CoA ligase